MECDVICLDSDEESEHDPTPKAFRSWCRPIQHSNNKFPTGDGAGIEEQLLRPLQALSLKLYFESDLGATWPAPLDRMTDGESRRTAVVRRVAELVHRFGRRKFTNSVQDVARQRDAWTQVLKFLFLLQAIGPGSMIYGASGGRNAFTRNFQCHQKQIPPETRRYRLTVMDVLVDYIRYKCHLLAGERNPAVLLAECNQLVSSLYIIFDGDAEFVTLTLLKMDPVAGGCAVALMYPVFEQILTRRPPSTTTPAGPKARATSSIMDYVRLLLCYKKWKAMVPARRDKEAINALAIKILPVRCPPVQTKQDLPFVRMLPRLSSTAARGHGDETRFLLAKDLMEIEQLCAIFFREYEKRFQLQQTQPKLSTLEIKSNYINIDALADFIQRKCNLLRGNSVNLGGPSRAQLQHESNAIISSLRLIFRCDEEFIALTLLRVETCPDCEAILGPVYERFLGGNANSNNNNRSGLAAATPTNVECYGRLLLCYVRWKLLYGPGDSAGHWDRIDGIALATLPYDFPRAIKRKELALKALFPRVASSVTVRGHSGGPLSSAKASVTRALLNSKHVRENIQELCWRFLAICSDGRINRGKPEPIPTLPRIPSKDKDTDDVEIIKTESTSIIVLDSEEDEDSTSPRIVTGTERSEMPIKNGASIVEMESPNYLDSLYDNCFETTLVANSPPTLLMGTVFNTPPPTPTEDDSGSREQTPVEFVGGGQAQQKKLFPQGVSLKISKNLRLYGDRTRRNFLTAFRKLSSAKRFHVRLRTDREDYYLRKHVSNQTVFVEIICSHGDILPDLVLQTPSRSPTSDSGKLLIPLADSESFQGPHYANLEGPILQDSPANANIHAKSRTVLDDQLISLLSGIEDFSALSPASLDFAILGEHENRSSLDMLTNDHAPPSSVLDGGASSVLWQGDIFSVISSGCDFNPWLDFELGLPLQALPPSSSVASFV